MKTSKFEVEIDLENQQQVLAFSALLLTIGGHSTSLHELGREAAQPIVEKKMKAVKETPAPMAATGEAPKETPAAEVAMVKSEPAHKLEEVRELLSKKVGDHREVIKAKLTELDAKNVTVLKPEFYDSFYEFLESL